MVPVFGFSKKELSVLVVKISLVELAVEGLIMAFLPFFENYLTPLTEMLVDPIVLVIFTGPIIAYWIIKPYAQMRDENEAAFKKLQSEREGILAQQKIMLSNEVRKTTAALRASEERYALAAKGANDGLWDWSLGENQEVFYSERWKNILGFEGEEGFTTAEEWFYRVHPDNREHLMTLIERSKTVTQEEHFEYEYRIEKKDGTYIWVLSRWVSVLQNDGQNRRLVGSQTDITERKRMEEQLLHDAFHDNMTGLPNRALLVDRIEQSLFRFQRNPQEKFALLFIDLDNFKRINDTMGHHVGDDLLKQVAHRLQQESRSIDTISRLGGDEFSILLPEVETHESLEAYLDRLFARVTTPLVINGHTITPSLSIGIALCAEGSHYTTAAEIIRDADLALYRAKHTGKARYSFFDEAMRTEVNKQFEISNNLRGAVDRGEISMHYQPIVDIQTEEIAGFEALMRWNHPRFGMVSPVNFIPLAEENELIHELGRFAIQESAAQLAHLKSLNTSKITWFMSVNVSGRQLEKDLLLTELQNAAAKHHIPHEEIEIEVTESMLINNPERANWILNEVKKSGFRLSIDDFGIGYSSLSTLNQYPFDKLKIDRSFIMDVDSSKKTQDLFKLLDLLGSTLKMKTVSEGIETMEQLAFLKHLNCTYGQGFLFSKPLPADELCELLTRNPQPFLVSTKGKVRAS